MRKKKEFLPVLTLQKLLNITHYDVDNFQYKMLVICLQSSYRIEIQGNLQSQLLLFYMRKPREKCNTRPMDLNNLL